MTTRKEYIEAAERTGQLMEGFYFFWRASQRNINCEHSIHSLILCEAMQIKLYASSDVLYDPNYPLWWLDPLPIVVIKLYGLQFKQDNYRGAYYVASFLTHILTHIETTRWNKFFSFVDTVNTFLHKLIPHK